MTRSIDIDDFGPTIEENIFRYGKAICVAFAIAAVSISTLDLMNIRAVEDAVKFVHDSRVQSAALPARVLAGLRGFDILPDRLTVTVAIPRDASAKLPVLAALSKSAPKLETKRTPAQRVASVPATRAAVAPPPPASSPVAELADARHADAIEFAMASQAIMASQAMASPGVMERPQTASYALASPAEAMLVPAVQEQAMPAPVRAIFVPGTAANVGVFKRANLDIAALPEQTAAPASLPVSLPVSLPMSAAIPLDMVPLPTPAPGVPPPSPAQRLHLEGKEYAKAERCLANAVYWEARSEPLKGQEAVAQVVMNRVFSGFYPNDVCGVVYQNASRHLSCQFTFACDGKRKVINERGAWARANRIAKQTLDGKIYVEAVAKSTHYHATYVHPYWTREMRKLVRFGIHNFYRPYAWGNGAAEPVWGKTALASNKKK